MTPHEVIKNNIEKFDKYAYYELPHGMVRVEGFTDGYENFSYKGMRINMSDVVKSSQLSLLLSVKEMVKSEKWNEEQIPEITDEALADIVGSKYDNFRMGHNKCIELIQSLLDNEIEKVKEL